jgi:SAM-dependent methyltransferase
MTAVATATHYRGFTIEAVKGGFEASRTDGATVVKALTRSRVQSEIDALLDDASGLAVVPDASHAEALIDAGVDPARFVVAGDATADQLRAIGVDRMIVSAADPMAWLASTPEREALMTGLPLEVVFPDARRVYRAHDLGRLRYLKAYLQPMLAVTGPLAGKRILEVGCSDGLTCDLLMRFGATSVDGVDTLPDVGARYETDGALTYHCMSGEGLAFEDGAFDVVYSIATLEHVTTPEAAMLEMLRVTKRGGVLYQQAGPLYHSPFGHHMFGYFDDFPWAHVRLTPEALIEEARRRGMEERLHAERGFGCEHYIRGMLSLNHINGLRLDEYGLDTIRSAASEVLLWEPSYEGEDLLTDEIAAEMPHLPRQSLVEHGFQFAVRR